MKIEIPNPGMYVLLDDFKMKFRSPDWRQIPEVLMLYGFESSNRIQDVFNKECQVYYHPDWIVLPTGTVMKIMGIDIKERKRRGLWSRATISFPTKQNVLLSKKIDVFDVLKQYYPTDLVIPIYDWNKKPLVSRTFKFDCDTQDLNGIELEKFDEGK